MSLHIEPNIVARYYPVRVEIIDPDNLKPPGRTNWVTVTHFDVKPVTDSYCRFLKLTYYSIPPEVRFVVRRDTLLKRFRSMGEAKAYERIQTSTGCETMTHTQACRFRELQNTRLDGKANRRKPKSHYSLKEAARLLRSEVDDILLSAAAGRLQCFVMSAGLWGHWLTTGDGELRVPAEPAAMPRYLALSPADCQQIATYGSVNVYDLEYPAGPVPDGDAVSTAARFILREPLWVDRKRIVLTHPLPQ